MGNVMLLSAAYSWFIGLLVLVIIMAVLFIFIALLALKPIRMNGIPAFKPIVDSDLTEAQAESLENETEKVAIEKTFSAEETEGIEKSFTALLIQSSDEIKVSYFEIKNCILCYEKTKVRMHWNNEKFYIGKKNIATLTLRGKTLCLYLALDAAKYSESFGVKATVSTTYGSTPCLYRIKGQKDVKEAKELIAQLMADYGVMYVKTNHSIYALPYEDDASLLAKGLAKHNDN